MNEQEKIEQISQSTHAISEWSKNFLASLGINDQFIKYINLIFLLALVIVLVYILQVVTRKILTAILKKSIKVKRISILEHLLERDLPRLVAMIVPFSLVKGTIPIIFNDFPSVAALLDTLANAYLVFYVLWIITAALNAFEDTLGEKEYFK